MEKSKIELIKEWIETCPQLDGGKINVDYLKDTFDIFLLTPLGLLAPIAFFPL